MSTRIFARPLSQISAAGVLALTLTLTGCGSGGAASPDAGESGGSATGQVTVYGPGAVELAPVFQEFSEEHPEIQVNGVRLVGQEVATRLQSEVTSGQHVADVVIASTATAYGPWGDGSNADWFDPYVPAGAVALPEDAKNEAQGWYAPFADAFGVAYNSEKVPDADAPSSWEDLVDPQWNGRVAVSDPTIMNLPSMTMATLSLDGVIDDAWMEALAANSPQVTESSAAIGQALGSGAADAAVWGSLFFANAVAEGSPLTWVQDTTILSPTTAVLMKEAPNPEAAKVLMDWLMSDAGQQSLADSGYIPLTEGAPTPEYISPEQVTKAPVVPPYTGLNEEVQRVMKKFSSM